MLTFSFHRFFSVTHNKSYHFAITLLLTEPITSTSLLYKCAKLALGVPNYFPATVLYEFLRESSFERVNFQFDGDHLVRDSVLIFHEAFRKNNADAIFKLSQISITNNERQTTKVVFSQQTSRKLLEMASQNGFFHSLIDHSLPNLLKKGHPLATHKLAHFYWKVLCLPSEARVLFEKAAKLKVVASVNALSVMYFEGEGGEKSFEKSFELAKLASEYDLPEAHYNCGFLWERVQDDPKKHEKAADCYVKALGRDPNVEDTLLRLIRERKVGWRSEYHFLWLKELGIQRASLFQIRLLFLCFCWRHRRRSTILSKIVNKSILLLIMEYLASSFL